MLDHVGFQCTDLQASTTFYETVLAPLGGVKMMDYEVAIGFGIPPQPNFWISVFDSGEGFRESHIAFQAKDRATVRAFFDAAVAAGAEVLHEPRVFPEYHENYYGTSSATPTGTTSKRSATFPSRADQRAESGGGRGQDSARSPERRRCRSGSTRAGRPRSRPNCSGS